MTGGRKQRRRGWGVVVLLPFLHLFLLILWHEEREAKGCVGQLPPHGLLLLLLLLRRLLLLLLLPLLLSLLPRQLWQKRGRCRRRRRWRRKERGRRRETDCQAAGAAGRGRGGCARGPRD